ncbi:metal ABC transporter permease [Achromobacter ruhlandii]|uniref:Manganese transport system membrane protein MntB n=1 Tax=Achromobacter ruhlandii TaxID=72557 RepID=A0ABM8LSJ1_9BURK|nr:metal ABC transporter permease [Achromobacter ruhlandii]AKP92584.1 Zinc ABC transporter, inner membrane permease protein ZnuB [Achromobacter xylosoxidans]AOU96428.1 zinc ABC transporter inner membrane permease ZnuB [Achromobacter ruhlandii]MCZ8432152.1 metal ABC transporter permease [Achromobacter ruhlandii]MDC6088778.1 metal ABC transporter permease [Achromobacter ruhlandii]MDC6151270.1 metal ABC transporter permease [Achromobacter ruhlandii]
MTALQWAVAPFLDYGFMRRALAGASALSLGAAPLGVFLVLRRMSLMGDAMSHAILPGVAAGFLLSGLSLGAMMLGGIVTGLAVALLAGLVARLTPLREDASFAAFYLISLGLGVLLVSLRGSNMDLLHVLFGTVLGLDDDALLLVTATASVTLLALAGLYRLLVAECLDPGFLRASGGRGGWVHMSFLVLVVVNLVAGFQVLGTLMVVGIMMLPAAAARFWMRSAAGQIPLAAGIGVTASIVGLLVSYHFNVPASPAIILAAGVCYLFSIVGGPHGGLLRASRRSRRA